MYWAVCMAKADTRSDSGHAFFMLYSHTVFCIVFLAANRDATRD